MCRWIVILFLKTVIAITDWEKVEQLKQTQPFPPYFLPNTKSCFCIPIEKCLPLFNLLSFHPVHPDTIDFLRNQTCGFHGSQPYVCCFEQNNPTSPTPPSLPQPRIERCMTSTETTINKLDSPFPLLPRFHPTPPSKYPFHQGFNPYKYFPFSQYNPNFIQNDPPSDDESPIFQDNWNEEKDNEDATEENKSQNNDPLSGGNNRKPMQSDNKNTSSGDSGKDILPGGIIGDPLIKDNQENMTTIGKDIPEGVSDRVGLSDRRKNLLPDETCGLSVDERITGGKDVKNWIYPWMARLGYTRPKSVEYIYRCGGSLINERYVITAAHCTTNLPNNFKLATVRLGEMDERTDPDCEENECADLPQDFTPIQVIVHHGYDVPKYKNDIALIKLNKQVKLTSYVSPICLPHNLMKSTNYSGVQAVTAGWGVVSITSKLSSPILQHVKLTITDPSSCASIYSSRFNLSVSAEQLCTQGENGSDACEGDSGGPLMSQQLVEQVPRYFLLGIVSFGPTSCGTAALPSVFTRVTHYMDWIVTHLDEN